MRLPPFKPGAWRGSAIGCAAGLSFAAALPAAAQVACSVSTQGAAFGSYAPRSPAPTDSTGNIAVSCSGAVGQAVNYRILLDSGAGGSFFPRRMSGPSALTYNLYTDATRSTVWGDGNAGTSTVADAYVLTSVTVTRNHVVYGRLFAGQNVNAGSYADSVMVTVNF